MYESTELYKRKLFIEGVRFYCGSIFVNKNLIRYISHYLFGSFYKSFDMFELSCEMNKASICDLLEIIDYTENNGAQKSST